MTLTTPYYRDLIKEDYHEAGVFMTPYMMRVFSEGEYFEADVTFPGLPAFKYLLNITTFNCGALRHDVVARVLMTRVTGKCYKDVFNHLFELITDNFGGFKKGDVILGITVDFSLAQANGIDASLKDGRKVLKGCRSVHFMRAVDRTISKVCISPEDSALFRKICIMIKEVSEKEEVSQLFGVLDYTFNISEVFDAAKRFTQAELSMDRSHWTKSAEFVKWWNRERVLILLTDAYREMTDADWNVASNNTNHVESLNRRSVVDTTTTTLHGQLSHMYREDRKRAFQHIASVNEVSRERQKSAKKRISSNSTTNYVGRKISTTKGKNSRRRAASQQRTADIIKGKYVGQNSFFLLISKTP